MKHPELNQAKLWKEMNYRVTVNDLVQAYWEKEACNLSIICTAPEEHPSSLLKNLPKSLKSLGTAVPRDSKGQNCFPLF